MRRDGIWSVRISASAAADYQNILDWTAERFGEAQVSAYADNINNAIDALRAGPKWAGLRSREELGPGLHSLHIARRGRQARHLLLLRVAEHENEMLIEVLRILHDSMDIVRHIPR